MIIYLSALVALIGLVLYLTTADPKKAEIGRVMLWTGLLAFLLGSQGHAFSIPPH